MSADEPGRQRARRPQLDNVRRDMAEAAPELTVRLNREGRVVALLPPVRIVPGLIAEELIGRHYLDFIHDREQDRARQAVALLLGGVCAIELVLHIRRNNGKSVRIGVRAIPWYEGERLAGVQGTLRLILGRASGQLLPESAFPGPPVAAHGEHGGSLSQGRAALKLLSGAAVGLAILRRGRFLYLNEQLSRMTGYEAEILRGRDWNALFFEATDRIDVSNSPAGADREQTAKVRWLRADGRIAEVWLSLAPLQAGDGCKPGDVALTAIDITSEIQTEAFWKSAGSGPERYFQISVPLCLLSLECRVVQVNQAFADFFHCTPEEAIGSQCATLWGCESCGDGGCIVRQMRAGRNHGSYVLDKMVGGRHLSCMFHAVPCRDAAGRLNGVLVAFFESHKLDKKSVDFQTIRRQLVQAERLSTIGALAASIAHEFNNPLCGIRAVIERTARKTTGTADRGLLQMALDNCDHMSGLIRNLQQFNLPSSDEHAPFDLHHAIDSVLILLDKYLKIRKASVVKECGSAPLVLRGCESRIKQMMLNLIKSRGEAMPEEGGEIRIRTDQEGDKVRIVLSDTGTAIEQEELPRLFEPFCSNSTGENGFGLSVSHDIVKAHGGDILVESSSGQGTVFTVILPVGIQS